MPAASLEETVKLSVQRNKEIPAMLDAYGEFVDSQIGPLELSNLERVFSMILDNLMQRFPDIASKRAANTARADILSFLALANNDADLVRKILRNELRATSQYMGASIAERFTRMNNEERSAVDATLRLIRRSPTELLFRADAGSQLSKAGKEYERFFAAVRAQAPTIRELRYENLVIEKAILNKLLLKSNNKGDYTIWVPSIFVKDNVDYLIERLALPSEHILLSYLKETKSRGDVEKLEQFLESLVDSLGVLPKTSDIPEAVADYFKERGNYKVMTPLELDDVVRFLQQEKEARETSRRIAEEEERARAGEELRREEERRAEQQRLRRRPTSETNSVTRMREPEVTPAGQDSILIGKRLESDQFMAAISRRMPENEMRAQVKTIGDYYLDSRSVRSLGVSIIGSSGSGRSTTLRRLLDGLASSSPSKILIVDQKGEHRGLAWKYNWQVYGFVPDSQVMEFRVQAFSKAEDSELVADLLQEWCLNSGLNCSDQQRARISSIVKQEQEIERRRDSSVPKKPLIERIVERIVNEPDTAQLGQKLLKNFIGKGNTPRIFGESSEANLTNSIVFDISGRGLKDPTTREERQMLSVLILRDIRLKGLVGYTIVLEDVLDRFKSESLKRRVLEIMSQIKKAGNSFIVSSRGAVRDFMGPRSIELVHRLSGERTISEELQGFQNDFKASRNLASVVAFLPRGFALTSTFSDPEGRITSSSAIRIEPLQF